MYKRPALACLLALILLAGCSPASVFETGSSEEPPALPADAEPTRPDTLSLPLNLSDPLNPYRLTSQVNFTAAALLYDGLYAVTPGFEAEPRLAASAHMSGSEVRVTLRSGATFWDGTAVAAEDVVYSYQFALLSANYGAQLRNVVSCTVDGGAVVFTLTRANHLILNNLNFPILKTGTATYDIPTGSGRFMIESADSSGMMLTPLDRSRTGPITRVELIALGDDETIASALKIGLVDTVVTTQSSREELWSGVDMQSLDLNALNYLAIESGRGALASAAVRRAIYLAVDRDELAQWSYGSKAVAAYTPFNPAVSWLPDVEFVGRDGLARAISALEEAGFLLPEDSPVRTDGERELRFELLVNGDNATRLSAAHRIAEQLARAGMAVTVVSKSYDAYVADYNAGSYDLCLAEVLLSDDMNLELARPYLATGFFELSNRYVDFLADAAQVDAFLSAFLDQNPFVPLVYRHGTLASTRHFDTYIVATKWDIFYNMANW